MPRPTAGMKAIADEIDRLNERTERIEKMLLALVTRFQIPVDGIDTGASAADDPVLPRHATTVSGGQPVSKKRDADGTLVPPPLTSINIPKPEPFTYPPIIATEREIRLLKVLSTSSTDVPMRFKLRSFELGPEQREYQQPSSLFSFGNKTPSAPTTHPAYNALSYTWGSPEKTSFIVVNGSQFPVTPNLEAALRRLHGTVQYLWVDAICINQDDIHERNSQVSLMRSIYKTASRVCVWLGEEADDSALAMDAIAKLANAPHRAPGQAIQPYATPSNEQKLQTWSALWALFQRPWFSRVWVRQEIALGSDVGFYCGQHSCNYNDLEFAVRGMDWLYGEIGYHPSPAVRTLDILNPPYHYFKLIDKVTTLVDHGRQFAPLEDLLANTQSCNATDSRDKIYAVLGLADPEIYNIKPDYGRPPRETYMAATRRMVEGSNSLSVLNVSPNPHRVHGLPSWVPDFSGERKMRPIPQPPSKGHFSEPKRIEFVSKAQKQCLQVEGDLIDQVRAVSDWLISTSDDDDRLHKIFAQWRTFVRQADVRAAPSGNGLFGHASSWKRLVGETLDSKISDSLAEEEWLSFLSLKGGSLGFKFGFQTGSREHTRIQSAAQTLLLPEGYSPKPKPYPSLYRYMRQNAFGRRICLTHRCEVALVSDEAKVGDKLCLLHGNPVVLLLRKEGSAHTLVGDAYIHNTFHTYQCTKETHETYLIT